MCVRRLESILSCRQKSVTSNFSDAPMCIKLDADVTATDTTQTCHSCTYYSTSSYTARHCQYGEFLLSHIV